MMETFQVVGGGALLIALSLAARRAIRRMRPRTLDLGVVSDRWKAQIWLRRDDPAGEP